jgi:hypothetical protein
MSNLNQTIKELYAGEISDGEIELAKYNLLGFFKLLQEVDTRLQREANSNEKERLNEGRTAKPRTKNQSNNSVKLYEDNGN